MSDLTVLRSEVLGLSTDAPVEHVADMLGRVEVAGKALKEIKALCEERVLEYVREHGAIAIGDILYYEGTDKKTVCLDTKATADAILTATAGDLESFCEQLAKDPFKYGAVKKLLGPERWAQFFEVRETPSLETGKPTKKLLSVNQKYAGGGSR